MKNIKIVTLVAILSILLVTTAFAETEVNFTPSILLDTSNVGGDYSMELDNSSPSGDPGYWEVDAGTIDYQTLGGSNQWLKAYVNKVNNNANFNAHETGYAVHRAIRAFEMKVDGFKNVGWVGDNNNELTHNSDKEKLCLARTFPEQSNVSFRWDLSDFDPTQDTGQEFTYEVFFLIE